jgi:hypothetical protein
MADEPPLVSCNNQFKLKPNLQAISIAESGEIENDEIANPSISL